MTTRLLRIFGIAILTATPVLGQSPERLAFPDESPGAPSYALISDIPGFGPLYTHTDEWAAVVFVRDPRCVPEDFNLLDEIDFVLDEMGVPRFDRVWGCPMTVQGYELWKIPPPEGIVPISATGWGLGAVPIYFVSWPELQGAVLDRMLTIAELEALPSLRIGFASFFHIHFLPGLHTKQAEIQLSGRGILQDGQQFQLEVSASGVPLVFKHVQIALKKGTNVG